MNGERYRELLREKVVPVFGRNRQRWFQQDGASCHYASESRTILDESLRDRWIGRRGPVEWPRSPDLTACDNWFWPYLRRQVYNTPCYTFPNLITLGRKIKEEISGIPLHMFRRAMTDFSKRVHECFEANVDLFEH